MVKLALTTRQERLDLFIDLLWVGIISNIAEHYFEQAFSGDYSAGLAYVNFSLLFLPAWSMWALLQLFLNTYYMDDVLQRGIIVWFLILGLVWGNNAPYFLQTEGNTGYLIVTYLVALATIRFTEIIYSIWLPFLRRSTLAKLIASVPMTGLWLAATVTQGWVQYGLVCGAVVYGNAWGLVELTPMGQRIFGDGLRTQRDWKHTIKRWENFFVIALGEGVILLIRTSPLGAGYTVQLSRGIMALMIYFFLHLLYFNSDQAKTFVHPLYRRWWMKASWFL